MRCLLLLVALCACERRGGPPPAPVEVPRDSPAFRASPLFESKRAPGPHDWLARFDEPGQSFEAYAGSGPVRAREGEVLAFLPVGPFTNEQRAILEHSVEFARIWFELETRILPPAPLPERGWQRERPRGRQYRTPYFLDHLLPEHMPDDAVCLFGVTLSDLYPGDRWNYVFGQASLRGRVGVYSFVRYFPEFWGRPRTEESLRRALRRACRVMVHEAGHTFGLHHCTLYECVMNGSNNLEESDSQPLHLCPICLAKLTWNRGFDVTARYRKLAEFYLKHGLEAEASWTARRLDTLERN